LPEGGVLAAWYACSYETSPDSGIYTVVRSAKGEWAGPTQAVRLPATPVGNPVLWTEPDGAIRLCYVVLEREDWRSARIVLTSSSDESRTWTTAEVLTARLGLMTRNRPFQVPDGSLLLAIYDEIEWAPLVLRRASGAWRLYGDTTSRGVALQPALADAGGGRIVMLSRGRRGRMLASWSVDGGRAWTASRALDVPNPNSGLDAVNLLDGRILLAYNHSERDRLSLDLAVSADGGATWSEPVTVARTTNGELSYPCLLAGPGGLLHLAYTVDRTHFNFHTLDQLDSRTSRGEPANQEVAR
jgi:predicted neuraminidase